MSGFCELATGDCAAAAAIHAASFNRGWTAAELANLLGGNTGLGYAARHPDGGLAGFTLFCLVAGEADMLTLATAPAARRRGIARGLVVFAAGALARRGAARMTLDVATDNGPALALYRGLGFTEDGRRPGYYPRAGDRRVDGLLLSAPVTRIAGLSAGLPSSLPHDPH